MGKKLQETDHRRQVSGVSVQDLTEDRPAKGAAVQDAHSGHRAYV